eukprot:2839814-Rhodomonas_salina.6
MKPSSRFAFPQRKDGSLDGAAFRPNGQHVTPHLPTRAPVLTRSSMSAILLREVRYWRRCSMLFLLLRRLTTILLRGYAMSGTDIAHAGTRYGRKMY